MQSGAVEGGGCVYEGDESAGVWLRVDLLREGLGPSGKGSMGPRGEMGAEIFFSTRDRGSGLELESSGSQLRDFCYSTGSAATPLGPFFCNRRAIQAGGIAGLVGHR